jgi:lysophospholipase L1-like esterase
MKKGGLDLTRPEEVGRKDPADFRYSSALLWFSLIAGLLLAAILLESSCLAILYVYDTLKGKDTSVFAREHILTRAFASKPAGPVPGKNFLGPLRSVHPRGWKQFLIADGLLGWHLPPNISIFYGHFPNTTEELIVTDANGFVSDVDDPPVALQKSVNSYRVFVLGGSTVMGQASQRPSFNIVGMLRKTARERGLTGPDGKNVEFINGGVDGYTSTQEYLYFVSDLLRFKPDLVIVYDGWNDININEIGLPPFRTAGERRITQRAEQSYSITGSAHLLASNLKYSLTEGDLKIGMIELPWRAIGKLTVNPTDARPIIPRSLDPRSIEYYRNNHQAFLRLADDELSVALFLQPLVGVDDRESSNEEKASWWHSRPQFDERLRQRILFYEGARRVLEGLKAKTRDNNHICIADLSRSVSGVAETIYADGGHLLPKGNQIVAGHILDELVSCGLLH